MSEQGKEKENTHDLLKHSVGLSGNNYGIGLILELEFMS